MARENTITGPRVPRLKGHMTAKRASLIVSLVFHVCFLLVIQKVSPMNWIPEPLRTYHIELLRPPVDLLEDEETDGMDLAGNKPDKSTPPEETEETISLDTKDKRYVSYATTIKEMLGRNWQYPLEARENLIEGKTLILFSLIRDGNLREIKILQSSRHDILDKEAKRTIHAASPFPPFPESVTVSRLNIKVNFSYQLVARQ